MASTLLCNMSLYIGYVRPNIGGNRIADLFKKLRIGQVSKIDFVEHRDKNKNKYNIVYIHFDFWYNNEANINLQKRLRDRQEARIVYDDPWYWIVKENLYSKKNKNKDKAWITHLHAWNKSKKSTNDYQRLLELCLAALNLHKEHEQNKAKAWDNFCQQSRLTWNTKPTPLDTAFTRDTTCLGTTVANKFMTFNNVKLRIKSIETILKDYDIGHSTQGEKEIINTLKSELKHFKELLKKLNLAV